MRLPLRVNHLIEVVDADGMVVADFWTVDYSSAEAEANAQQYVALMNARYLESLEKEKAA